MIRMKLWQERCFINTWIVQLYSSSAPEPISMLHLSCRFQSSRGTQSKVLVFALSVHESAKNLRKAVVHIERSFIGYFGVYQAAIQLLQK